MCRAVESADEPEEPEAPQQYPEDEDPLLADCPAQLVLRRCRRATRQKLQELKQARAETRERRRRLQEVHKELKTVRKELKKTRAEILSRIADWKYARRQVRLLQYARRARENLLMLQERIEMGCTTDFDAIDIKLFAKYFKMWCPTCADCTGNCTFLCPCGKELEPHLLRPDD